MSLSGTQSDSGHRHIAIVSPALREANNGNWRTARRWRALLGRDHTVRIISSWPDAQADRDTHLLALHARRSADSTARWAQAHPGHGLVVVLTGTDLYRDIDTDPSARAALDEAQAVVVLQALGVERLTPAWRRKARVIYQSTSSRQPQVKAARHLRALMVGHLRDEKDPLTLLRAARLIDPAEGILIDHVGAPIDPALAHAARETMRVCPHYRWLGALPHEVTRRRMQRAHLLVHASRMEGGAHVVMEAICGGTPVLASDIPGNRGMLGARPVACYFPVGDAPALADRLRQCRHSQSDDAGLLARAMRAQGRRATLFHPDAERAALLQLIQTTPTVA